MRITCFTPLVALLFLFWYIKPAYAQHYSKNMTGEYHLSGVMETASGLLLNPDSTFKFFYSYGALDRYGEGKWSVSDNILTLNSRPRPERDFHLVRAGKSPGDSITISIKDENTMLLRYVDCAVGGAKATQKPQSTDDEGIAKFKKQELKNIALLFRLCPDRPSVFKIDDPADNYFEFSFEPWIVEVFFDNFTLDVEENKLTGKHPLLMGEKYIYLKRTQGSAH